MVIASSHAGHEGVDKCPSCACKAFPLDDNHSPAFAEDHPISLSLEWARGLVNGSFLSGKTVKCSKRGEFQKMQVCEIIFPASDDGGIDDAIPDHLDGAVKCNQGGRAGRRDCIARPHEPILIADKAGRCAVESSHECSVVR